MPLRHDMRNATGGILAAPLCIASPEPHWLDSQCVPAPVVMSYEVLDPARDVRQVVIERDVIHLGRTMGYSRSRTVDADDPERVIAVSSGMGVSLGDDTRRLREGRQPPDRRRRQPGPAALARGVRRRTRCGQPLATPTVRAEFSAPHAALHLGPINIVLEVAAMEAAADHAEHRRAASRELARHDGASRCHRSLPSRSEGERRREQPHRGRRDALRRGQGRSRHLHFDGDLPPRVNAGGFQAHFLTCHRARVRFVGVRFFERQVQFGDALEGTASCGLV